MAYLAADIEELESHESPNIIGNAIDFIMDTLMFSDEASTKMERFSGALAITLGGIFGTYFWLQSNNDVELALFPKG